MRTSTAQKSNVVCLMGPTASGKTGLGIELIKNNPDRYEIVNVDSALIYKDMNIGTAKPDNDTLQLAPHHLIDLLDPKEAYSAAQFRADSMQCIEQILARHHVPLLIGGTMLYFRALQFGLAAMPAADEDVRQQLEAQAQQYGWQHLHDELARVDPASAARIHPNDPQRLQRALEVYRITGKTMTELHQEQLSQDLPYDFINIAIAPQDRAVLHARIAERFDDMLTAGFVEEVKALYERGDLTAEMPSMRAVGYRQGWQYLDNQLSYDDMRDKAITATRQLAKRQLTWLRSWDDVHWFDSEESGLAEKVTELLNTM